MSEIAQVVCHTCDGEGYVWETAYKTRKQFKAVCPECNGDKFVTVEVHPDEYKQ